MNRLDLIIDNIEYAKLVNVQAHRDELLDEALAAARELRELKPVAWMLYGTHCHLRIPHDVACGHYTQLYALDEVKHD